MDSGKPQKQALAISYDVQRRNKRKKMAEGGDPDSHVASQHPTGAPPKVSTDPEAGMSTMDAIKYGLTHAEGGKIKKMAQGGPVSAKSEKRPMPDQTSNDSKMVSKTSKKSLPDSGWTDQPTVKQAQKPSITPLSRPKMANSAFKVRDRDDVDKEERMMLELGPNDGPQHEPDKEYNEEGPDRQGPKMSDNQKQHSDGKPAYAKGGMINDEVSMSDSEEDNDEHPAGLEMDNDQISPAHDEYMAGHFAQGGEVDEDMVSRPDKGWGAIIVKGKNKPEYAEGGEIGHEEQEMDHHDSIAAAIMAKRDRMHAEIDSGAHDMDDAVMMAEGGQVDLSLSSMEQPNEYYPRNEDEILKENFAEEAQSLKQPTDSNEQGDAIDSDKRDMISSIRSKMNKQRQFKGR